MPHLTRLTTTAEFVNEAILLAICYHFVLLADLVADPKTVDQIGQSLVCFIMALLVFNVGIMLLANIRILSRKFQLWRLAKNQ
jgi:hypothetical protein